MCHSKNVVYYLICTAFKGATSYMGIQIIFEYVEKKRYQGSILEIDPIDSITMFSNDVN